jgi:hypothetical protein
VDPLPRTALRPRLTSAERPAHEALLLDSISRRDHLKVRQLAQALVHRRGFTQLERFRQDSLTALLGEGAATWFDQALLLTDATLPGPEPEQENGPGETVTVGSALESSLDRLGSEPLESRILSEVDAAIAAMMATFPPEPAAVMEWSGGAMPGIGGDQVLSHSGLTDVAAPEPLAYGLVDRADLDHQDPRPEQAEARHASAGHRTAAAAARRGLERLRRQWPRAAALVQSALLGSPSDLSSGYGHADLGDLPTVVDLLDTQPSGEGGNRSEAQGLEPNPSRPIPAAGFRSGASLPPLEQASPPANASDAERLRSRLAQHPQAEMAEGAPAPRPRALAELGAWLPDAQLPRAS